LLLIVVRLWKHEKSGSIYLQANIITMSEYEHKHASIRKEYKAMAKAKVTHLLVEGDVAEICQICQQYPELAMQLYRQRIYGDASLLECLIRSANIANETVEDFCRQFPKSLSVESDYGLPLHSICRDIERRALIPLFVQVYPEATRVRDGKGDYPIHDFFDMICGPSQHFRDATIAEELLLLLDAFPESLLAAKSEVGQIPLNYAWAFDLHQNVIQCMMDHAPRSGNTWDISTLFLYCSCVRRLSAQMAQLLAGFLPHLKKLVLNGRVNNMFEPEGWIVFFRSFTRLSQLTNLEIVVPYDLVSIDRECYAAFAETLPQLTSLKSFILSFQAAEHSNGPRLSHDLAPPIAALIRQGNLCEFIVRDGVALEPQTILHAITDNPQPRLTTLHLRPVRHGCNVTDALTRMIASNGPLESLAVNHITFEQAPVFDALACNTHLKVLRLPGLLSSKDSVEDADKDDRNTTASLCRVLRHHNVTLERMICLGATYDEVIGREYRRIQYYTLLNRLGRAKLRLETCTCQDIVQLLEVVSPPRSEDWTSVVFGLLREAPSHWCAS
jgi:hypothetical protein